jgi:uncharacterized protein
LDIDDSAYRNLGLHENEIAALDELVPRLRGIWPGAQLRLFGSKMTGAADEESDLDMLVLIPETVTAEMRKQVIHEVFEVNLDHDSTISPLIMGQDEWEDGIVAVLPIHSFIEEEGVAL